jgi:hypothetical protein
MEPAAQASTLVLAAGVECIGTNRSGTAGTSRASLDICVRRAGFDIRVSRASGDICVSRGREPAVKWRKQLSRGAAAQLRYRLGRDGTGLRTAIDHGRFPK